MNYQLSPTEWELLCKFLNSKPTNLMQKAGAEACLYKFTHRLALKNRSFGWHNLPASFGITGASANRLFRKWCESGQWVIFWDKLLELRSGEQKPNRPNKHLPELEPTHALQLELQRAYDYFNRRFLGGSLPKTVCISIDTNTKNYYGYTYFSTVWLTEKDFWYHIAVTTSAIRLGTNGLLRVLLHEMAHVYNANLGYEDTSEQQYHTQDFRDVARLLGLATRERCKSYGYAKTSLAERGAEAIAKLNPVQSVYSCRFLSKDVH